MKDGPVISTLAALMGDPARANILTALMDGCALTVTELAQAANVTIQTTSGHLAKLAAAQLISGEKQGRHRYFRLSGPDVAHVLESLMGLAQRTGALRVRTGPRDNAIISAAGWVPRFSANSLPANGSSAAKAACWCFHRRAKAVLQQHLACKSRQRRAALVTRGAIC